MSSLETFSTGTAVSLSLSPGLSFTSLGLSDNQRPNGLSMPSTSIGQNDTGTKETTTLEFSDNKLTRFPLLPKKKAQSLVRRLPVRGVQRYPQRNVNTSAKVPMADPSPDSLDSVSQIVEFVEERRASVRRSFASARSTLEVGDMGAQSQLHACHGADNIDDSIGIKDLTIGKVFGKDSCAASHKRVHICSSSIQSITSLSVGMSLQSLQHHPGSTTLQPAVTRYSRKMVQKMGNRLPRRMTSADITGRSGGRISIGEMEESLVPIHAKCSQYESWVKRKADTTKAALGAMGIQDAKRMAEECQPGLADCSMFLDTVARNACPKRRALKLHKATTSHTGRPSAVEDDSRSSSQRSSVLNCRRTGYLQRLRESSEIGNDPNVRHTGDPLLDTIFDLYVTDNRHHLRNSDLPVPESYVSVFKEQGVECTHDNVETFVQDATHAVARATLNKIGRSSVSTSSSKGESIIAKRRKSAAIRNATLLNTIVNAAMSGPRGVRDARVNAFMEGPEFPQKVGDYWKRPTMLLKARLRTMGTGLQSPRQPSAPSAAPTAADLVHIPSQTHITNIPMDKDRMLFEKEYYRRLQQQAAKRKSFRIRKRWWKVKNRLMVIMRFCRNMSERSFELYQQLKTFVDIGDMATTHVDYGGGRSIDTEMYKRKQEITINSEVKATLRAPPKERTLVQLDQAVRELQKVQVFSEYPVKIQEKMIRKAIYFSLGPKRVIVRQGQCAQFFFIIVSGEAVAKEIIEDPETGQIQAVTNRLLFPGMTFGEVAIMTEEPRTSSVISRSPMQLLGVDADGFVEIFIQPYENEVLLPHMKFVSMLDILQDWPVSLLSDHPNLCTLHYFRRNTVITHDSHAAAHLYIVKTGYCEVFRRLDWKDKDYDSTDADSPWLWDEPARGVKAMEKLESDSQVPQMPNSQLPGGGKRSGLETLYLELTSEHVKYKETRTPRGEKVMFPITKLTTMRDPMETRTLSLPKGARKFIPIHVLRETDVFGLDQMPINPKRNESRTVILVSLGAECIALHKGFYCRHATQWTHEVVNHKAFIYDDRTIRRRLSENVNRDVHLEAVLDNYFRKLRLGN